MSHQCPSCKSTKISSKGLRSKGTKRRYVCKECKHNFTVDIKDTNKKPSADLIKPDISLEELYPEIKGVVVTSALNDTSLNLKFLSSLERYCEDKKFKLFVLPIKYMNPSAFNPEFGNQMEWPNRISKYLLKQTIRWKDKFKIIGDLYIQATASHPLSGIDRLSEGITTIVGHSVLQMKTLPVNLWNDHVILHSTGSISNKNKYSASKAGYQASFHHCFAAVVLEFDDVNKDAFHLRQLLADSSGGFHDLDSYWNSSGETKSTVTALVCGDEHVIAGNETAYDMTFYDKESMVNVLKPKFIVRHDMFDCHSVSKWHEKDYFTRYRKEMVTFDGSLEKELKLTCDHLMKSTPCFSTSIVVQSNHHNHLDQWLNEPMSMHDYKNAKIYHWLSLKKLEAIEENRNSSGFITYFREKYDANNVRFISEKDNFTIHGILLSMHGHNGPSGAKGTMQNISRIGEKTITGHFHSPAILGGAWFVGTLSNLSLDYTTGPSGWMHTNCIIHNNGKRQLVSIINGRWKNS